LDFLGLPDATVFFVLAIFKHPVFIFSTGGKNRVMQFLEPDPSQLNPQDTHLRVYQA
jgi:hypothetical protein